MTLDSKKYTAAILMDLYKAYDCIPCDLILAKLNAYGLSANGTRRFES